MSLRGASQLRTRLKAIRTVFKPVGRKWANEVVTLARPKIPVRTGKTQRSVRVRNASQRKATVVAFYPVNFIDAGTKAHTIQPKKAKVLRWQSGGNTYFSKKINHPRTGARPFKKQVAEQALRKVDIAADLIKLWNDAA